MILLHSMIKIIGLLLILANGMTCVVANDISGIRFWQSPEKTRLVFDASEKIDYKLFILDKPYRLVIDIAKASLNVDVSEVEIPQKMVKKIRASHSRKKLRIVIDLKQKLFAKHFILRPVKNYNHRLVVDLIDKNNKPQTIAKTYSAIKNINRDIIIAIDAGHGGDDPGASGIKKTREKSIALAVAKRLAKKINATKGLKAILTRKGDYFVSLRKRTDIARKNKADLFISLHADAFRDKRVKGASVWVLSPKGASSEMGLWLEQGENQSDLAGGVDISNKDPLVAQVLLDLSMHYSVGASINAANSVYAKLRKSLPKMHSKKVQKAAFVVLSMPDIPAMLVEMAFISNPTEEKRLKTSRQQNKIASAIFYGVKDYFKENPPDGSYYASLSKQGSYKVKRGDTLSDIASHYGIPMSQLKTYNKLKSTGLRIGQILIIPGA